MMSVRSESGRAVRRSARAAMAGGGGLASERADAVTFSCEVRTDLRTGVSVDCFKSLFLQALSDWCEVA